MPASLAPGARIAHPTTGHQVTVIEVTWDRAGALVNYECRGDRGHWEALGLSPRLWRSSFALIPVPIPTALGYDDRKGFKDAARVHAEHASDRDGLDPSTPRPPIEVRTRTMESPA